jgi:hypothetical protein
MKTYWGTGGIAHSFFDFGIRKRSVYFFTASPSSSGGGGGI